MFVHESLENDDCKDNDEDIINSPLSNGTESGKENSTTNILNNSLEKATIIDDLIVEVNKETFICFLCENTFCNRKDCRRHIENLHFREKDNCSKLVPKKSNAEKGLQKSEDKNDMNFENLLYSKPTAWILVKCNLCNKLFINCKELRQHLENHSEIDTLHSLKLTDSNIKFLFPNATRLDAIKLTITKDISNKQWFKYYTVLNQYSYEMSISDTEEEDLEKEAIKERKNKYKCSLCTLEFSFKYQVFQHSKVVHSKKKMPFYCEKCKLKFVSIKMYSQHLQTHCNNELKLLVCERCPAKFVCPKNRKDHYCCASNHQNASYTLRCCLCSQNFSKLVFLRNHLYLHADGKTGIDFQNCLYIKNFKCPESINNIAVQQEIQTAFRKSQISRFYQAADKFGNEIDISDSESDCDTEETNKKYNCAICIRKFKRRRYLLEHQKQFHKGMQLPFACAVCHQQFVSDQLLPQHLKKECNNEARRTAPQCEICNARFIWSNNMIKHKETQHYITSKPSIIISSSTADISIDYESDIPVELFFITNTAFQQNLPNSKQYSPQVTNDVSKTTSKSIYNPKNCKQIPPDPVNDVYECPICKVSFSSKENLIRHVIKKHKIRHLQCIFCKAVFHSPTDLRTHKEVIHNDQNHFMCLFCDKSFSQQVALNVHINEHMRAGFYKCTTCQKSFKHSYELKIHFLTHSNKVAFRCELCDETFACIDLLKRHQKLMGHAENNSKTNNSEDLSTSTAAHKVVCPVCGVHLSSNTNIKLHMSTHSGDSLHKFKYADASVFHYLKRHLGETPFQCLYCEKSYATHSRLINHMRVHTGEPAHQCTFCKRAFNNSNRLKLHLRIHTGKIFK